MIRLGLLGGSGRMGQHVKVLVETDYADRFELTADPSSDQPIDPLLLTDGVIDFSSAAAMTKLAEKALEHAGALPVFVVGSTGWDSKQQEIIAKLSERTLVLQASNLSTGIMAVMEILKNASPILNKLGYSPVLIEAHHKHKKDAPSGTALTMAKRVDSSACGNPTQIQSIRAGEIIGDHDLTFYGPSDRISISHHADNRSIFARGALDVAQWLVSKSAAKKSSTGLLGGDAYLNDLLGRT